MFALVDAVSFYASAEKVFDPTIRNRPVVVLTNNDGCICAVCPIAKKLNIPKFEPYFKVKELLEKHNVIVRSSNYELYADLSARMMNEISRFSDNQYIYSIDESFLNFNGFNNLINDWHEYGHTIRKAVWRKTKIPVGVGFGPTATLAKAANHAAKKLPGFDGVAVINNEASRKHILKLMAAEDVWGVGRRISKKLKLMNIHSALDLANQPAKLMRKQFSVVLERTINELNGTSCLSWDDVKQKKKEVYSTRSFGERISDAHSLRAAFAAHCNIVARKLRKQGSLAKRIVIFAHSSPFEEHYYKRTFIYEFPVASNDVTIFANAVKKIFLKIYSPNVRFQKCGIGAIELEDEIYRQGDLFNHSQDKPELMQCLDTINQRFGNDALKLASEKQSAFWHMRRAFLSPKYTTRWSDIPRIKC
ncbi:Y-family DNA polymerase [Pseudoalteromonas sp. G4]|uniref:Y-family DNA polymerase n=1 Tax=Pseudoalteromonas sp. G4 TaxID=2992761 RepID=UPI00237E1788|nr:Y-family DNA polymerase [Pseudoalteromonas sp. G4]MDE3271320.1 Y-family DNA polymerase [Pseudoalteromonas sp. G4]